MTKSKKGKHKTVEKELKQSIKWLESQEVVTKLVLGIGESARHSYTPGTIRYQMDAPGGVKMKAYGGTGVMDLYVKVKDEHKATLLEKVEKRWQ